jgi:hypothetical protein
VLCVLCALLVAPDLLLEHLQLYEVGQVVTLCVGLHS